MKTLKKALSIFLAVIIGVSVTVCAYADEVVPFTVSCESVACFTGDDFAVNISAPDISEETSFLFYLNFDPTLVEFVSAESAAEVDTFSVEQFSNSVGFTLTVDELSAGTIITVNFEALAAGNAALSLSLTSSDESAAQGYANLLQSTPIQVEFTDGAATITDYQSANLGFDITDNVVIPCGSEGKVFISLAENPGITAMRLFLNFDHTKLSVTNISRVGNFASADGTLQANKTEANSNGCLSIVWGELELTEDTEIAAFSDTGNLICITFKALTSAASGNSAISFSNTSPNAPDAEAYALDSNKRNAILSYAAGSVTIQSTMAFGIVHNGAYLPDTGETVALDNQMTSVILTAETNPGVKSFTLYVNFDPAVLDYVSATVPTENSDSLIAAIIGSAGSGSAFKENGSFFINTDNAAAGELKISWTGTSTVKDIGKLIELNFSVANNHFDPTDISYSNKSSVSDSNGINCKLSLKGCTIHISDWGKAVWKSFIYFWYTFMGVLSFNFGMIGTNWPLFKAYNDICF